MEGGQLGGDEWTRHGSFVNKPTRGWLHSDSVVSTAGVSYTVRVSDTSPFPVRVFASVLTAFLFEERDSEMRGGQHLLHPTCPAGR